MKKIRPDKTSRKAFKITKNVSKQWIYQMIPYEDYKHLKSINEKDRTQINEGTMDYETYVKMCKGCGDNIAGM